MLSEERLLEFYQTKKKVLFEELINFIENLESNEFQNVEHMREEYDALIDLADDLLALGFALDLSEAEIKNIMKIVSTPFNKLKINFKDITQDQFIEIKVN